MPVLDIVPGGRTLVMGVINATPDSFWSGSRFPGPAAAVEAARAFVADGADLLDIGGQSTHPRATPISAADELARVMPVLRAVRAAVDCPLSIDTFYAEVAEAAVAAGADIVNDVSGLGADPAMPATLARLNVPVILMDRTKLPREHPDAPAAVAANLRAILRHAEAAGIDPARVILDPGFGFGKTARQNLTLVRDIAVLAALGRPLCYAVSRKGTIGLILGDLPPEERLEGSLALAVLCAAAGVAILRAHDVRQTVRALRMVAATLGPRPTGGHDEIRNETRDQIRDESRDEIRIEGIAVEAIHGVLPEERRRPQPFHVDATLRRDLAPAGRSDDLAQTVNYAEVAAIAVSVLSGQPRNLIEALAEEIAGRLMAAFAVDEVEVRVHKPEAPVGVPFADVSVAVRRRR
jgi:dihydropteroate synthase/dihydroneopterin aldolase